MAGPPEMDLAGQDGWSKHERGPKTGNPNEPRRHHNNTAEKKEIIYLSLPKAFR